MSKPDDPVQRKLKSTYLSCKWVVWILSKKPSPCHPGFWNKLNGVLSTQRKPLRHSRHIFPSTHCCDLFHSSWSLWSSGSKWILLSWCLRMAIITCLKQLYTVPIDTPAHSARSSIVAALPYGLPHWGKSQVGLRWGAVDYVSCCRKLDAASDRPQDVQRQQVEHEAFGGIFQEHTSPILEGDAAAAHG